VLRSSSEVGSADVVVDEIWLSNDVVEVEEVELVVDLSAAVDEVDEVLDHTEVVEEDVDDDVDGTSVELLVLTTSVEVEEEVVASGVDVEEV